ncbi:MAG: NADH-quinone oxidoreductase subunit C [Elusimicrobia bacterium]|nr:NADH-quinone oxidoreductase subunit C [Elusimicrobiota bacterium]
MTIEQDIQQTLIQQFPFLDGKCTVKRARRLSATVDYAQFRTLFDFLADKTDFCILCTITGLDEGEQLSFIYHLAREDGVMIDLKTSVPKTNPIIKTVFDRFPAADIYERELIDLLGTQVEGLNPGRRYPLPDTWPIDEHPLRKDWKEKEA